MILKDFHAFINDYHETLMGLHCGQTARANHHLVRLLDRLIEFLQALPPPQVVAALPVIQSMAAAKERDDSVSLADTVQFELPQAALVETFGSALFEMPTLLQLKSIARLLKQTNGAHQVANELGSIYADNPEAFGLAFYFAESLSRESRSADLIHLLQAEEKAGRLSPASAYSLSLLLADNDEFEQAERLMDWAYTRSQKLQDGYAQLGWKKGHHDLDWNSAYQLMNKDRTNNRISPFWLKTMAQAAAHASRMDDAKALIADCYQADGTMVNGYTRIGWCGYLLNGNKNDYKTLVGQDRSLGRFSEQQDAGPVFQAAEQVFDGEPFEQVYAHLTKAAASTPHNRNWFSVVGWLYIREGSFLSGYKMMLHDYQANLMDKTLWFPSYTVALLLAGEHERAKELLTTAQTDNWLTQRNLLGYSTMPDAVLTSNEFEQLILNPEQSPTYQMLVEKFRRAPH